jgi:hypothetical protein
MMQHKYGRLLKSITGSILLVLGSCLLSGCPGAGVAREAGERVASGIMREGSERVVSGGAKEAQEQLAAKVAKEAGEQILPVPAIRVSTEIQESAEFAATRRLEQIREEVEIRSQIKETAVEFLCDSQNFQELSVQVYDAAYAAAYEQGMRFSNQGVFVSEEQVREVATNASNEVLSYYCKELLSGRS